MDRLVSERDESQLFNRVVCIRNEFSKENITKEVSEMAKIATLEVLTGASRATR